MEKLVFFCNTVKAHNGKKFKLRQDLKCSNYGVYMLPLVWFVVISALAKPRIDSRLVGCRIDTGIIRKPTFAQPMIVQCCAYIMHRSAKKCFKVALMLKIFGPTQC